MNVSAEGYALYALDQGHGSPALVFLHHFGGSSNEWAGVVAALESEYRCVVPDLRGFGSSGELGAMARVDGYADDVLNLVRRRGLDRFVLIGHSMGGKIAMAVAAREPPRMVSLVLLAPSPPTPEPIDATQRVHLLANQRNHLAAKQSLDKDVARPLSQALAQRVIDDRLRCSPGGWRWWLDSGSCEDISAHLDRIRIPVQVMSGELDSTIPTAIIVSEVMSRIPQAVLRVVPGCGHLMPLEAPKAVARCIRFAARR